MVILVITGAVQYNVETGEPSHPVSCASCAQSFRIFGLRAYTLHRLGVSGMAESTKAFVDKVHSFIGESHGPYFSWDPVNQPMIRHLIEALGDTNPVYTSPEYAANSIHGGIVAPPTMLQSWTMRGYTDSYPEGSDPSASFELNDFLYDSGFTGVVAVNCEQEYLRYLKLGDRIHYRVTIDDISDEKSTALGVGFFVNQQYTFYDEGDEPVGKMLFRILRYKPRKQDQGA
jgi:acyl dehydratase